MEHNPYSLLCGRYGCVFAMKLTAGAACVRDPIRRARHISFPKRSDPRGVTNRRSSGRSETSSAVIGQRARRIRLQMFEVSGHSVDAVFVRPDRLFAFWTSTASLMSREVVFNANGFPTLASKNLTFNTLRH